jgi:uncharacterized protein (DUF1800 family)
MPMLDPNQSEDPEILNTALEDEPGDPRPMPAAPVPDAARRQIAPASLSLLSIAALAACGGGGSDAVAPAVASSAPAPSPVASAAPNTSAPSPAPGAASAPGSTPAPTPASGPAPAPATVANAGLSAANDEQAARFLQQAQFSSIDSEIASVRSGSYADWLQRQYDLPISTTGWDWLENRGYGVNDKNQYFFSLALTNFMVWNQLFTGADQMRKRLTLSLSEFFVISLQSAEFDWRSQAFAAWWDMLSRNSFGNYRQLLQDVTLNPAMGYYLNTKGNQKEDTRTGRVPDENYAREVMQLFSIGLYQLNPDGTEKTDASGKKVDVYTQSDVTNLARVFTGYDFDASVGRFNPRKADDSGVESYTLLNKEFARRPMVLDANKHSALAASFLGVAVPAGTAGAAALTTALDTLFNHPNTAPFFSKQMIQRLVTSNPSPAYVGRVADVFVNNGAGVRGDLKAVWSAILLDSEARSIQAPTTPGFGKLREPIVRYVQWGRSFGFNSASGGWKAYDTSSASKELGQSPLNSPSVFNFFRPGFVPPGTALAASKSTAPEFQLVNESTVGGYLNYMQLMMEAGIFVASPPGEPNPSANLYVQDITASFTAEVAIATDAAALVARLNLVMCAGRLSADTSKLMVTALNATPLTSASSNDLKLNRVRGAVLMVLACAEYLIQK